MKTGNTTSGSSLPKYLATAGVTILLMTPLTGSVDSNFQNHYCSGSLAAGQPD